MRQKVKKSVSILPEREEKIILEILNFNYRIKHCRLWEVVTYWWAAIHKIVTSQVFPEGLFLVLGSQNLILYAFKIVPSVSTDIFFLS